MKELFTIGEMAKLFGVNIRTLRYYDEIGILCPETTDPDSGYRYYSTRQFERMNSIKYLRALDMPLKSIALFFEKRDVRSLQFLMEEQKLETRRKINALLRIERKLERRLAALEDALRTPTGEIREIHCEKRRIVFLRKEIQLEEDLEYPIRELELSSLTEPAIFLGKVGVAISKANLLGRRFLGIDREEEYLILSKNRKKEIEQIAKFSLYHKKIKDISLLNNAERMSVHEKEVSIYDLPF